MPAGVIPLRTLCPLRALRTLDLRLPLRAIGAIPALGSFHTVFAPVLAAVDATIFLPGMVGTAVFLPIGAAVLLTIRAAVFLPVRLAIGLPISAAIFLANVGLREGGGSASQGQGGDGDCNDSFLPHERLLFRDGLQREKCQRAELQPTPPTLRGIFSHVKAMRVIISHVGIMVESVKLTGLE
jgi:hypothetical protein